MLIYRILLTLVWPGLVLALIWRVLRGREQWRDLAQRLSARRAGAGNALWIHGASNGELASARAVLTELANRAPARPLLITANTVTARDMVAAWQLPGATARLAPIDTWWAQPRAAAHVTLEAELWPNRIRRIPTAVLGARISPRTAAGWARVPGLAQAVFPRLRCVIPQDSTTPARFAALGVARERIAAPVQLKALYRPPDREVPDDIARAFDPARSWLAASTHDGEEQIVLAAQQERQKADPGMRLILAPRHPARFDDVAQMIAARGLTCHRRSAGPVPPAGCDVLLADTMGEMDLWYRAAAITFVGGSLVARGGHTPYEPAALGSAILHGPHVANFAESYAALHPGGAVEITDAATLAQALARLSEQGTRATQTAAARAALGAHTDAASVARQLAAALKL